MPWTVDLSLRQRTSRRGIGEILSPRPRAGNSSSGAHHSTVSQAHATGDTGSRFPATGNRFDTWQNFTAPMWVSGLGPAPGADGDASDGRQTASVSRPLSRRMMSYFRHATSSRHYASVWTLLRSQYECN
ncbi:hypothetical protein AMTR_s00007p00263030 [Amborella trichopoda]|uniref:Uncharacterized protein n=1 Tax=Amborella trichopoda TaxID=13333 RepID=W1PD21_AMBTC|nr:hypothetical protein AMTR_s00007p00263030 [Amborella trichopoda]